MRYCFSFRFSGVGKDPLQYTVSVEDDFDDREIPPLLFIPFVENAEKHNFDTRLSYMHIGFKLKNGQLHFECKNSKPAKPAKRNSGGLGLTNIRRAICTKQSAFIQRKFFPGYVLLSGKFYHMTLKGRKTKHIQTDFHQIIARINLPVCFQFRFNRWHQIDFFHLIKLIRI